MKFIESVIYEYLNDMEVYKKSNLNDNFWKWFGNSVTIKNNVPIICYHGTDHKFKSFNKNKIGVNHWQSKSRAFGGGFFFTDIKRFASHGNLLKTVYLKIENPLIRTVSDYYYATDMYDNNSESFLQKAKEDGNDGVIIQSESGSLYIVFESNQIKSIDNDGTWDISDSNIYS